MIKDTVVPLYLVLLIACGTLILSGVSLSTPQIVSANVPQATQLPNELTEATALTQTVVKLFQEQKFDEALPLAKRALEIRERLLPSNDPLIELSLLYLGDLYLAKRKFRESRATYERAFKICELRLGSENVALAPVLDRLAVVYYKDGAKGKAEKAYHSALTLRERKFGPESSEVAHTLYALGELYRAQSDANHGLEVYKKALSIFGKVNGVAHQDFEKARIGFTCLAYQTDQRERLKELEELRGQFPAPVTSILTVDTPLNGKALRLPKPEYPEMARAQFIQGVVILEVLIDEEGNVIRASDLCESPRFITESSLNAARGARFAPTQLDGKPVKVLGVLFYRFVRQ
jgi:TonB family protein